MQNNIFLNGNINVKKIVDYLQRSDLKIGEKLPSERELSEILGVSRNSLREALKILQTLQVLEIRRGSGIYLLKTEFMPTNEGAGWLLTHKGDILNMLTVRETLDLRAIELIPEEQYSAIRTELKQCVKEVRQGKLTNEQLFQHDLEFHNIIRNAAGNEVLTNICISLTGNIYDERRILFANRMRMELSLEEHNHIANTFGTGDVNEVKQAYIAHFVSVRRSIEDVL